MIINLSKSECENELAKEIMVGEDKVTRSSDTKLLGVPIDDLVIFSTALTRTL